MKRWFIIGASGFLGQAVLSEVRNLPDVLPVCVGRCGHRLGRLSTDFVTGDFHSDTFWLHQISQFQPVTVLNLAGMTPPGSMQELWNSNYHWVPALVESLNKLGEKIRLVHAGSAAELGEVPESQLPVAENYSPSPLTDYGNSKLAATNYVLNHASGQVSASIARLFNLCGPGQGTRQAFGRYAAELVKASSDLPVNLAAFGLDQRRDFLDIRDAAKAIIAMAMTPDATGLFHVGRGQSHSVRQGLNLLIQYSGCKVTIHEEMQGQDRPHAGPSDSFADISRLRSITDWKPEISFETSLLDFWNDLKQINA